MVLFETNCITYLIMLIKCFGVITSAGADNLKILIDKNGSQIETITCKKFWIQRYNKENNSNISENNKTCFYRPWEHYSTSSTSLKNYPSVSSTSREKTVSNTLNDYQNEPLELTTKCKQNETNEFREKDIKFQQLEDSKTNEKNSFERTETVIHRSQKFSVESSQSADNENEVTHESFKYTISKTLHTTPNVSRNIKHTITNSDNVQKKFSYQRPSSSFQDVRQIINDLESEIVPLDIKYTTVIPLNTNYFAFKYTRKGVPKNSIAAQVNTHNNNIVNVPIIFSDAENIPNYYIPSDYKIATMTNSSTNSHNDDCMETQKVTQSHKKKRFIKIKCMNLNEKKYQYILVERTKEININEIWAFKRSSYVLYDTPYLVNKRRKSVCEYLFHLNEYIFFCKAEAQDKKFRSLILEFESDTNTIKSAKYMTTQHLSVKNFLKANTFCRKFCYKIPIFVALNFTSPPNLKYFTIAITKSDYSIIYTVGVLISFVGDIKPNINNKFIIDSSITDDYILNFILVTKFPIYSFEKTLSGKHNFYFGEKYTLNTGNPKSSMKIKKFIKRLKNESPDPKKKVILSHFKEIRRLKGPNDTPVPIERYIAKKLIFDDCVLIKTNLYVIKELLLNTHILNKKEKLKIKESISNILQNLELSWCIKYQESAPLSESECQLISFYLFFYYEVRYVLEYWLTLN